MEAYIHCQSCGMPLDRPGVLGTEKDGSKSCIYCINCYRDGDFTHEDMTLSDMKEHVRELMRSAGTDERTIREAVARLPHLSRWLGIPAIHHSCEWH